MNSNFSPAAVRDLFIKCICYSHMVSIDMPSTEQRLACIQVFEEMVNEFGPFEKGFTDPVIKAILAEGSKQEMPLGLNWKYEALRFVEHASPDMLETLLRHCLEPEYFEEARGIFRLLGREATREEMAALSGVPANGAGSPKNPKSRSFQDIDDDIPF